MKPHYQIAGASRDIVRCSRDAVDGCTSWITHRDNLKQALIACRENMRSVSAKYATVEIFYGRILKTIHLRAARGSGEALQ
jgi:hypothetical protein